MTPTQKVSVGTQLTLAALVVAAAAVDKWVLKQAAAGVVFPTVIILATAVKTWLGLVTPAISPAANARAVAESSAAALRAPSSPPSSS